ncbi:hypothetical protein Cgig2_005285 [Carnegiea gigantea]|uniref:Growth-regulating factor n=1 Tax=Carnegiea gigantea TaxID=171969 RepID=A0A9Q1GXZ8_9CARY|nr:hypothetical protein Cgig2_005285 [Carnegiea gigantea]
MDFNLKQWRDQQQESEEEQQQQPSAKIPRQLFLETPQHQHQQQEAASAALPLFVYSHSEAQSNKITAHFSPSSSCSSSTTPSGIPRFPRGGCGFSISQWQELELQALIFKHMIAGAAVPQELLQLVKKSLLTSSASPFHNLHHYPPHFQPAACESKSKQILIFVFCSFQYLVQAGYWGKGAMDPEPGRCRRTDGKKWRCSRDVVAGHKYCERHMHRGRNRSRKPVEFPASAGSGGAAGGSLNKSSTTATIASGSSGGCGGGGGGAQFSLSGPGASLDAFQLNQGSSKLNSDEKSSNKVLMHFFDDWPRSNNAETNNSSSMCLSISNTTNSTSDFLRLSTGNGIELGERDGNGNGNEERQRGQLNWGTGWGANSAASMGMGGPLAEALRSSSHSSPTSVLHQLPRGSDADTSYVTA